MIENVLASVICSEFEHSVGRGQLTKASKSGERPKAMKVSFSLHVDYDKEEGYRHVDLLIFGPMNYVGVYVRERWVVIPLDGLEDAEDGSGETFVKEGRDYERGEAPWEKWSYHDSCWRTDGVERFMHRYADRIATLDSRRTWYEVVDLDDELLETLNHTEYATRG